jgi:hypothetical protein
MELFDRLGSMQGQHVAKSKFTKFRLIKPLEKWVCHLQVMVIDLAYWCQEPFHPSSIR